MVCRQVLICFFVVSSTIPTLRKTVLIQTEEKEPPKYHSVLQAFTVLHGTVQPIRN